jgi:hypothetical protein
MLLRLENPAMMSIQLIPKIDYVKKRNHVSGRLYPRQLWWRRVREHELVSNMAGRIKNQIIGVYSVAVTILTAVLLVGRLERQTGKAVNHDESPPDHSALQQLLRADTSENIKIFTVLLRDYLEKTHGAFFTKISEHISSLQLNQLREILVQRDVEVAEARRMAVLQRTGAKSQIDEIRRVTNDKVKTQLGGETLQELKSYEDALPQRTLVNEVNEALIYKGAPLTASESDKMIDLIKTQSSPTPPLNASLDQVDQFIDERTKASEKIISLATGDLSPVQIEAFRAAFDLEVAYWKYYKTRKRDAMAVSNEMAIERTGKQLR